MRIFLFFLLTFFFSFVSCKKKDAPAVSFYCWKTNVELSPIESSVLHDNAVTKLYVRYFDVDQLPGETEPKPIAPVVLGDSVKRYEIIPVVFIKKRVFDNIDTAGIASLARHIFSLIEKIDASKQLQHTEVQFDCDWTETTKDNYFSFLRAYRSLSKQAITATIRLHQVKYQLHTGVPPVDRGVLMYYNMGEIDAGQQNSIYDKIIAAKYNASLTHYSLPLDVALPIFAWGQQVRDEQVVGLLNKITKDHFANDSNFILINDSRLRARHPCFNSGYYFQENDEIKLETVSSEDLMEMSSGINKYLKNPVQTIIFYDLDSINIQRYDNSVYKEILDRFN